MIIVGAVMPRMSSSGHEKSVVSSLVSLSTSTGNFSGCGAVRRYASSNGEPANNSGVFVFPPPAARSDSRAQIAGPGASVTLG